MAKPKTKPRRRLAALTRDDYGFRVVDMGLADTERAGLSCPSSTVCVVDQDGARSISSQLGIWASAADREG